MTDKNTQPVWTINVPVQIPVERILSLLCSALEGGSNYWYMHEKTIMPWSDSWDGVANSCDPAHRMTKDELEKIGNEMLGGKPSDVLWSRLYLAPFFPGGALIFSVTDPERGEEDKRWTLNMESIRKGLETMAHLKQGEGGHHFGDFMAENDDATTGDVFLQCCLFGEIVYC